MVSWSSRFSKPEDAAELHAIFKGDNIDDGDTSALKKSRAGRTKLQKRFSRDSTLTNQRSRRSTTVGISEEEVARREEVKRIRAKRLQEELGDICVYDEDAKPLCSSPFGQAPKNETNGPEESSQDDSVNAIINSYSSHRADPGDNQPLPSRKMAVDTSYRSDSPLEELKTPLPPVINPKNMPNIGDTSVGRTSWRLSFTSPHRARCLRALSLSDPEDQGKNSDNLTIPTFETQLSAGKKKKWLSRKGQMPLEAQNPRTAGIGSQVLENAPAIPLHEMQISQRLASAGTYIPPQQSFENKARTHDGGPVSPEEGFQEINTRRSRHFRNVSGSGFSESKVPSAWGQVLGDRVSSFHISDSSMRSSQSSPATFVIPPESWANFPSHNRESRYEGSEPDDGVAKFEFAMRALLDMLDGKAETLPRSPRRDMNQKEVQLGATKPIYQGIPDAPKITHRGSMDDLLERRGAGDGDLLSPEARAQNNRARRRDKYKTWSGHEKSQIANMMALRESTVDFMLQAEVMENVERERALRAADEVLKRLVVR